MVWPVTVDHMIFKEGRKCFIQRRTQHILFYGYMASDIW